MDFFQIIPILLSMIILSLIFCIPQYLLCRSNNKWLGLILPALTFIISIPYTYINSSIIVSRINYLLPIIFFFFLNIPTLSMLVFYYVIKRKYSQNREIVLMSIEDLE